MATPVTILFLGANPSDSTRIALDREVREIAQRLRGAEQRDAFRIEQAWAVRTTDLQEQLFRFRPTVVHFSGHGSPAGELIFMNDAGLAVALSTAVLANLFRTLGGGIRCVVLNACFSEAQAEAISGHVDCVVGMSTAMNDGAALAFAGAFYEALGHGCDVHTAFELGCSQIALSGLAKTVVPKLLVHDGLQARNIRLVGAAAPSMWRRYKQLHAPSPRPIHEDLHGGLRAGTANKFESIFISYGHPDEAIARKLYEALHRNGVTTFFFPKYAKPGEKLHRLMRKGVNEHDRVILVCSRHSLDRKDVLNEIEEILAREARDGGASYLLPIRLDDYVFTGWKPPNADVAQAVRDRVVVDFEGADKNDAKFQAGLQKLIRALRKGEIINKLPQEREAIEKLDGLLDKPGEGAWTADRLYHIIKPSSRASLTRILYEAARNGLIDTFVKVESPSGRNIAEFRSVAELPAYVNDWRTGQRVAVEPENIRIYYQRVDHGNGARRS